MPSCHRQNMTVPPTHILADENLPADTLTCPDCGGRAFMMHRSIHGDSELRTFECLACGVEIGAQLVPAIPSPLLQVEPIPRV